MKLSVIVANRKQFDLAVNVDFSHCRSIGRMCTALHISLFWIWNDDKIRLNSDPKVL